MRVNLTLRSGNVKTGKIPVSTTEEKSCPSSCAWYKKGCYAKYGPLAIHWKKLSSGEKPGIPWKEFVKKIYSLPANQLWRHNQAGDLPGTNRKINRAQLVALVKANRGKRGFTYTHKPVLDNKDNANTVKYCNDNGFTVNLSADNLNHADKLYDLNIGPVVCVLPKDAPQKQLSPKGRNIILCPAQYVDNMNCEKCKLCAISTRKTIIGFIAHGTASKTVSQRASLSIVEEK